MKQQRVWLFGLIAAAVVLPGCGTDEEGTGRLSLAVTDAAVDRANKVVVQFTGVEIKPADGEARSFDFASPRSIDLLALSGGDSEQLLESVEVKAGRYNWVRLKVNAAEDSTLDSFIELKDGSQHELEVPSGAETGLKLISGFIVPKGGEAAFTLDFDLRKSVHEPMDAADSFKLRPTLRIVDNAQVGAISGTVATALVTTDCTPAVYVFTGNGVTPDDVDGIAPEPLTSAIVELDNTTGTYRYRAAFLSAGSYTVSLTCQAEADNPAQDDAGVTFTGTQDATVVAHEDTTVNFPAP